MASADDVSMNPPTTAIPLDVLSNIAALISPPFHPASTSLHAGEPSSHPSDEVIQALDPTPLPAQPPIQLISAFSRSSERFLEAARPWLWENVDVRSGRGWLAIVNALTEEVIEPDIVEHPLDLVTETVQAQQPSHGSPVPVSGPEAHRAPSTISSGFDHYIATPSSSTYPDPYQIPTTSATSSTFANEYSYSPPQPSHLSLLLTPPTSRHTSPSGSYFPPHPQVDATPPPAVNPPTIIKSQASAAKARLRGRSRSPRRNVGFDTEGLQEVLDRSRSASSHFSSGSAGGMKRRSSLSKSHPYHERNDYDEEEDERLDEVMPLSSSFYQSNASLSPHVGDVKTAAQLELLPPPGPYIRHLSFTNFRTIGSRRSQEEAVRGKFVTTGRLEGVIKNAPNLVSLCMTEYVDSALGYPVIEEIFFRGSRRPRYRSRSKSLSRVRSLSIGPPPSVASTSHDQHDPPRPTYAPYEDETEEQKWKRRAMFAPLEALDLSGCVSGVFTEAMKEFFHKWLLPEDETEDEEERGRGRERRRWNRTNSGHSGGMISHDETEDESDVNVNEHRLPQRNAPKFRSLRRLCLRMCTSLDPPLITALILSCPNLTHLDLSNTRVPSEMLDFLTEHCPRNFRLVSLSLARCSRLSSRAIVDFICYSPAARDLVDLNLFVNPTQGTAIQEDDLMQLITKAPCFKNGKLRYLDLSSARLTSDHLVKGVFPPQPNLVSLGLSHIPTLPLAPIADFLLNLAPNVEILTLTGTATTSSLNLALSPLQLTLELHSRLINPLTTVPFSMSNLSISGQPENVSMNPGPTRLRVVELNGPTRRAIASIGNGEWKVVKSKGGRGWYVDTSAGWRRHEAQDESEWESVRHLPRNDPRRTWLNSLSEANGRVGSNVGWHSRKMEVIRGMGMLGREEGMAGAGAFAFEE